MNLVWFWAHIYLHSSGLPWPLGWSHVVFLSIAVRHTIHVYHLYTTIWCSVWTVISTISVAKTSNYCPGVLLILSSAVIIFILYRISPRPSSVYVLFHFHVGTEQNFEWSPGCGRFFTGWPLPFHLSPFHLFHVLEELQIFTPHFQSIFLESSPSFPPRTESLYCQSKYYWRAIAGILSVERTVTPVRLQPSFVCLRWHWLCCASIAVGRFAINFTSVKLDFWLWHLWKRSRVTGLAVQPTCM